MPVLEGNRWPTSVSAPYPATASNTSSSVSSSRRKIDAAFAPKIARETSATDWSSDRNVSSEPTTPAATAALSSSLTARLHVRRGQVEDALQLEGGQLRMLSEHERAQAGDVRRGEAVPSAPDTRPARPGDLDVDAAREELHRRVGVVEERLRVCLLVASDRDHRGEAPR